MKKIFTLPLVFLASLCFAQTRMISQAIISTKTTIIAPEEEDNNNPPPPPNAGGDEVRIVRFAGDGETKSTTWLKNGLIKTFSETDMGRTTIIRDNSKKITNTIMEIMGKKIGIYATDQDQEDIRKRMDSLMQSRPAGDNPGFTTRPQVVDIAYTDESRKISGFDCKKAWIITTRSNGKKDSSVVWYVPDMKLAGLNSTGGSFGGFGPQMAGGGGLDKLSGFPIQYERNMNRGRKMTVLVTKIVTDKEISDKEFELPKDVEFKSAKEMQGGPGGGPGIQLRIGS